MKKLIIKNFFLIQLLTCFFLSFLIYLSFRYYLIYESNFQAVISFLIIQFIIWGTIVFRKRKKYIIFFYNLFFIIFFNLLLTPLFHLVTFDVPTRTANYKIIKEYKEDGFFKGIFSGKHIISADKKGYRTNKEIDYLNKDPNTLRIFAIGASTTEEGSKDNNKIWSSLLENKLSKQSDKNIEVINVGIAGLRSEHHYITLKRIKKFNPDVAIFLMGINDWNRHIIQEEKVYLIPFFEIKYNYKKSMLFKMFKNINKQINRKLATKIINQQIDTNAIVPEIDNEAYLLPQIDSLNIRQKTKNFKPNDVSDDYKYWSNLIIKECKKKDPICIFLDQPTAYKKDISERLKKRLWMTPPNQDYTLSFEDLIFVSSLYNNWLKKIVIKNKLNFCLLSNQIQANTKYLNDDCHFSENGSQKVSDVIANYINLSLKSILN